MFLQQKTQFGLNENKSKRYRVSLCKKITGRNVEIISVGETVSTKKGKTTHTRYGIGKPHTSKTTMELRRAALSERHAGVLAVGVGVRTVPPRHVSLDVRFDEGL